MFTARGLSVVWGLPPRPEIDPSSIPGDRITEDKFYDWAVDRRARRLWMQGGHLSISSSGATWIV